MTTDLERLVLPPAQLLVHLDQADQEFTWQWIGHLPLLQATFSEVFAQDLPPLEAAAVIERARLRKPPAPQDLEQWPQADQAPVWQSVGQVWLLQSSDLTMAGQALPPYAASTVI